VRNAGVARSRVNAWSLGRQGGADMHRIVVIFFASVVYMTHPAGAQLIGVYQDSLASTCNLEVPFPGPPVSAYVVFTPGGNVDSIGGARLRVDGLPSGWSATVSPNPNASLAGGDLFGFGGQILFAECQSGAVVLWYVTFHPTSLVSNHELRVRYHLIQPVDAGGGGSVCPMVFPCLPATPGAVLPDALALLNSPVICQARLGGRCPLASDVPPYPPTCSWGLVKSVYR
jgi:hypothetical protein